MNDRSKILIVEDESIVAMELKDRLIRLGFTVPAVVASGEQALQKTEECLPDLILMDIIIKGSIDGIETAGIIKNKYDIPIIFLTAQSDSKTLSRAKEKSPYGYVLKPFKERELQISIEMSLHRHRLEVELKNSKKWLSSVLNSIGDALITTDYNEEIIFLNPVAKNLLNISQADIPGKFFNEIISISGVIPGKSFNSIRELFEYQNKDSRLVTNTHLTTSAGETFPVDFTISAIRSGKEITKGFTFVFRNISEQKKMQEELVKAQKLESLGVLAGGIAHNFNNILTAILGNISLTKMNVPFSPKTEKYLTSMEKATFRAQKLSNQLLTFSKGGLLFKEEKNMEKFIRMSVDFALQGSSVRAKYSIPENLWKAEIDTDQFGQVFTNLIINAMQAMPDGGTIQISAENLLEKDIKTIKTVELYPGKYLKIIVRDEGAGIPPENIKKIFDPFFTTNTFGRGLGLSMVRSIIQKHGGSISVESRTDKGAVFTIYLPAGIEPALVDNLKDFNIRFSGRALILEDEKSISAIAAEFLKSCGMETSLTEDGKETIELFRREYKNGRPFDVVIMDLTIPGGMGGKETLSELLKIDNNVRAIVCSGYSNDPVLADYKKYGFKGKIIKPYNFKRFIGTVKEVLDEK